MFLNKIEIRWSDLDPNQHLANSAYINFMSATRIKHMFTQGVTYNDLKRLDLGAVALREEIHYFKEVFPGKPVYVSHEVVGTSKDGAFYSIRHNFYDHKGNNFARGIMTGTWIRLSTRKIIPPETEIREKLIDKNKAEDFQVLKQEEIRLLHMMPKNIELDKLT